MLLFVEEFLYLMSYTSKRFWLDSKYKYVNIHFCVCRQQQICHFGCFITVLSPFYYKNKLPLTANLTTFNHKWIADSFSPILLSLDTPKLF